MNFQEMLMQAVQKGMKKNPTQQPGPGMMNPAMGMMAGQFGGAGPGAEPPYQPTQQELEQDDILSSMKEGGMTVEHHGVPFGDPGDFRIGVGPPGTELPKEGFPFAGMEDVGGKFAVHPDIPQDPNVMAAIQRYLKLGNMQAPVNPDPIDISNPNPLAMDISVPKTRKAGL